MLSGDADVLRKGNFPRELLPLTSVASQLVVLVVNGIGFVIYLAVRGELAYSALPTLVIPVATLLLLTCALSIAVSLFDVYTRDLRFLLGNILSVWFFLVPIVYRPRMAPKYLRWFQQIDPLATIVDEFRAVLYSGRVPPVRPMVITLLAVAALFSVVLTVFRRSSRSFLAYL